jgi:hypothetical protein
MTARDSLTLPKGEVRLDSMSSVFRDSAKQPLIGVTQGGSSRKDAGCRPAATNGNWRPQKIK